MDDESRRWVLFSHVEAHVETLSTTAGAAHDDLTAFRDLDDGDRIPAERLADLREDILDVQAQLQDIQSELAELALDQDRALDDE